MEIEANGPKITDKAKNTFLKKYQSDPARLQLDYSTSMGTDNVIPLLDIPKAMASYGFNRQGVLKGTILSYGLLREQGGVPPITTDAYCAFREDVEREKRVYQQAKPGLNVVDYYRAKGERLGQKEPAIKEVVETIFTTSQGRLDFYVGAVEVYSLINKVEEAKRMDKEFGMEQE